MAKQTQEPETRDDEKRGESKQVRIADDLAEMIAWIVRIEGGSAGKLLDPMDRAQIKARYESYLPAIEKLRDAEKLVAKVEAEIKKQLSEPRPDHKGKR